MAHKINVDSKPKGRVRRFSLPHINGRFGFSLFLGSSEVFLGVVVSDVEIEKLIKRRVTKVIGTARTIPFDPFSGQNTED
jgi:hypothetical protein